MKKSKNYILISVFFLLIFFGQGHNALYAQFGMGNTLAPLPGNKYPIIYSNDTKGGHHQVATIAERNAIPALRRQQGMLCTVLEAGSGTPKIYQLIGGILDVNWIEFSTSFTETDPLWSAASGNFYTKLNLQNGGESLVNFNNITDKPSTLLGYGISDAFNGSWSSLSDKPTTLAGYGITDALTVSSAAYSITSDMVVNWNSAFGWGDHTGLYKLNSYVPDWSEITNKPAFAAVASSGAFSDLSAKPTTLTGYGITDAVGTSTIQSGTLLYAPATGSTNNYVATLAPAPSGYTAGMFVNFKANFDNTGSATLNVNGLGAKTIKKLVTTDLDVNDIRNGQMVLVIYDGTNFQLLNPPSTLVYNNPNTITHGIQNISSAGSTIFTVPAGVHQIFITLNGSGGGGGGFVTLPCCGTGGNGGHGGSGGQIRVNINCIPSQQFQFFLDAGGITGNPVTSPQCSPTQFNPVVGTAGANGGISYVNDLSLNQTIITATSGGGGGSVWVSSCLSWAYGQNGSSGTSSYVQGVGVFKVGNIDGGGSIGGYATSTSSKTNGNTGSAIIEW